jgi:hypothetical protein
MMREDHARKSPGRSRGRTREQVTEQEADRAGAAGWVRIAVLVGLLTGLVAGLAAGQDTSGWEEKVTTLDGIMSAYYEVVSHHAGEWPDRERDFFIHHPDALVSITGLNADGNAVVNTMSIQDYHTRGAEPPADPFYEWELAREVQRFGNVYHVWSTYATSTRPDRVVTQRGINSIQLFWDGTRFWVMSWIYDNERPGLSIPEEYLPG